MAAVELGTETGVTPVLSVRGLTTSFRVGTEWRSVVRNMDLDVAPGETGEVLVEWNFVEADRLRGCLRAWIAKKITAILSLEGVSTFFVPAKRKVSPSTLGFDWAEVSMVCSIVS